MVKVVCLDSSTVVTFLLQEPGWQTVKRIIDSSEVEATMPGPVLTETITVTRRRGNMSSPQQIAQVLTALGLSISHPIDADPLRAAELLELSEGHAGPPAHPGKIAPSSLSFGDALILAIAERLQGPVVTRDTYWKWMVDNGLIGVTVLTF